MNEGSEQLVSLVHNIGIQLKTTAMCTQVRRLRYGYFTLDHALLRKDWQPRDIVDNIGLCRQLVTMDRLMHSPGIQQLSEEELKELKSDNRQQLTDGNKSLPG